MRTKHAGLILLSCGACACGSGEPGDHHNPWDGGPPDGSPEQPAWDELPSPAISLRGGSATSILGQARDGGEVRVTSDGGLRFEPSVALASWPEVPVPPGGGARIDTAALASDVVRSGTLRIEGEVTTGGAGAVRTIRSVDGDLVVAGTLWSGDLGTAGQSITLEAPTGTVFVTGSVNTAPDNASDGDTGGALVIRAARVVITGTLRTAGDAGGDGAGASGGELTIAATTGIVLVAEGTLDTSGGDGATHGGNGGAVAITSAGHLLLSGRIDTAGGDARHGRTATGGAGGALRLGPAGDLQLKSATYLRGGAAISGELDAVGGNGGDLQIEGGATIALAGLVDARGAPAVGTGVITGGVPGRLLVGTVTRPREVVIAVPLANGGGDGASLGGHGGAMTLEAHGGDLVFGAAVSLDGGASDLRPGNGGDLIGRAGSLAGGIRIAAEVSSRGGDAVDKSVDVDGGHAGDLTLQVSTHTADFVIDEPGAIVFDGGASSGLGYAGNGGFLDLFTRDGNFLLSGKIFGRGGTAPDAGGTGGKGGPLYVYTDTDADGIGGNQTITATGMIDMSGGAGTHGGSARNNGKFGVEAFPDGRHTLAVLLNSDTATGELTDGQIRNEGTILARGAANDGWGGDVVYHGRKPGYDADPLPGDLFVDGEGSGLDGQYFMQ